MIFRPVPLKICRARQIEQTSLSYCCMLETQVSSIARAFCSAAMRAAALGLSSIAAIAFAHAEGSFSGNRLPVRPLHTISW